MAPVKFDDIAKPATEVLNDDYQVSGYQFKAKQKTTWAGAVHTTTVDLFGKGDVKTPAKISWKLPKPLGCPVVSVEKLELDKAGNGKIELASEKAYPGLKIEAKSDLKYSFLPSVMIGLTYSGIKDALIKLESKAIAPQEKTTLEITGDIKGATLGVKASLSVVEPDLGVRYSHGPFFAALLTKDRLSTFHLYTVYKAMSDLKVAGTYTLGGSKTNGHYALGLAYNVKGGTVVKAKAAQDQSVSVSVKHQLAKGFTLIGGGKYETKKGDFSYGLQVSIE